MKLNLKTKRVIIVLFAAVMVFSTSYVMDNYLVISNRSESLPDKFFIIKKNILPKRGDIFAFRYSGNHVYNKNKNFIKIAKGIAGDVIRYDGRSLYINDKFIGIAKSKSLKGDNLTILQEVQIGEGKFFAYSPHKDSYDSRYQEVGLIDEKDIIGTAIF